MFYARMAIAQVTAAVDPATRDATFDTCPTFSAKLKLFKNGTTPNLYEIDDQDWGGTGICINPWVRGIADNERVIVGQLVDERWCVVKFDDSPHIFMSHASGIAAQSGGNYQSASCELRRLNVNGSRTDTGDFYDVYNPHPTEAVGASVEIQAKVIDGLFVVDWEACTPP